MFFFPRYFITLPEDIVTLFRKVKCKKVIRAWENHSEEQNLQVQPLYKQHRHCEDSGWDWMRSCSRVFAQDVQGMLKIKLPELKRKQNKEMGMFADAICIFSTKAIYP